MTKTKLMHSVKTLGELQKLLSSIRKQDKTIGFTPTMGALHSGHISLIKKAMEQCDISICSIFVNPTQFNNKSDLINYPRDVNADSTLLKKSNLDILFLPSVDEIYPVGLDTSINIDYKGLDTNMEGRFRAGHFNGVAMIVKRFLDIIKPDKLYLGQKDFQQYTIIKFMVKKLKIDVSLVLCPIVREDDGLAMSSRNQRLIPNFRKRAGIIFETLLWARKNFNKLKVSELKIKAMAKMDIHGFKPEYFEIINGNTLKPLRYVGNSKYVVACTAVWAGEIRLIDNMILHRF